MQQEFHIVPASAITMWIVIAISLLFITFIALFGWIIYSSRNAKFIISSAGITIRADMYGRSIPLSDLVRERAEIIDLSKQGEYAISYRSNGVGLPGYFSGWFKLKSGKKALAFVTKKTEVVHIPTTKGYEVFLSVEKPQEFITALKQAS